jgi:hypothetical protein
MPSAIVPPAVCQAEAIRVQQAQNTYNNALANYNRTLQVYRRNAASADELRTDQAAVDTAGIALNDAKYAQATCQNNAAAPANRNCVNLTLELSRWYRTTGTAPELGSQVRRVVTRAASSVSMASAA